MASTQRSTIFRFSEITTQPVGGKARGLSQLQRIPLSVPDGFVIVDPSLLSESLLQKHLNRLGPGPKAVRSSAIGEDGEESSFAGQFDSILHCKTTHEVMQAIERCIESGKSTRSQAYSQEQQQSTETQMCVIVQRMIPAKTSGVLFTADPVSQRRDILTLDATSGLGDKLVSGQINGESLRLPKTGPIHTSSSLLQATQLERLRSEALRAEALFQRPLDLEWAFDEDGTLYWLQARPITTLSSTHPNELDTPLSTHDERLTRGNIGEMMPGPVTPMTFSVFGRAIEVGLQDFYIACGSQTHRVDEWLYVKMHYNHLFLSLSAMYEMSKTVLLVRKENIDLSVVGEIVPCPSPQPKASWLRRAWNQWKQIRYLNRGPKKLRELQQLCQAFSIPDSDDPNQLYQALTASHQVLQKAYSMHYNTSAQSGSLHTALVTLLSGGKLQPEVEHHSDAAGLLVSIPDIEGANAVAALEHIATQIQSSQSWHESFQSHTEEHLWEMLQSSQGEIPELVAQFLKEHGHRCVREAELSELDWSQSPTQVIRMLQQQVAHRGQRSAVQSESFEKNRAHVFQKLKLIPRLIARTLLPKVRHAVARREATKSMCIRIQQKIKLAYLKLGELLVQRNQLDRASDIFFVTHDELDALRTGAFEKEKIRERSHQYQQSMLFSFDDVSVGLPYPKESRALQVNDTSLLRGIPVSTGTVQGRVRVIHNLEDAKTLEPGDIMVCMFTDVGWTPYFSTIAGLVTEIGSPLSHGAVVAREYGIPAVVSMKGAMRLVQDGAMMELNGVQGTLTNSEPLAD